MNPSRGEIWLVDLKPTRGHEQDGVRPALIFSVDQFNHGPSGLVVILPITRTDRNLPSRVRVEPTATGVKELSFVMCEQVRCISRERCIRLLGTVDPTILAEAEYIISVLLGLHG